MSYFFLQLFITTIISILIIYSVHSLLDQLKNNYSIKKTKDLVNIQNTKYQKMFENMEGAVRDKELSEKTTLNDVDLKKLNDELDQFINVQTQPVDTN